MHTSLSDDTKATLLLCGILRHKDAAGAQGVHTLTLKEYNVLAAWLAKESLRPQHLLDKAHSTEAALAAQLDPVRVHALLERGAQVAFAVEEWQRDGLWVLSRSDADYPLRYKEHLGTSCPPLLFGAGNRALLHGGGLAMVGSRNVDEHAASFAQGVGTLCAHAALPVISGGARGVDDISMQAALSGGGTCIGVLAENLLRKSVARDTRTAIADGRLLLLSPYHPRAPFSVGNAMGRNKLIYALADYALVVSAEHNKGGTWNGATEELMRHNARPVFVRSPAMPQESVPLGNTKLLSLGALSWPHNMTALLEKNDLRCVLSDLSIVQQKAHIEEEEARREASLASGAEQTQTTEQTTKQSDAASIDISSIYTVVLPIILRLLERPCTVEDISKYLDVNKSQLTLWLNRAVDEKRIIKLSRPVRYQKAPPFEQGRLTGF